MLGRTWDSEPVWSLSKAPPWASLVPCTALSTHSSSASAPTLGNNSLTQRPQSPWGRNAQGERRRLPVWANWTRGFAKGRGLPESRASRGLWSNVSTWDGPPCMNRKMTRRARGRNLGGWGDSGEPVGPDAAMPAGEASNVAAARPPNPSATRDKAARRLHRWTGKGFIRGG